MMGAIDKHGDVYRLVVLFETEEQAQKALAKLTKKPRESKKYLDVVA